MRNKLFWRVAAVLGLLILVVPSVLIAIEQTRSEQTDPVLEGWLDRLRRDPYDIEALENLGAYYLNQGGDRQQEGNVEEAVAAFETAANYYNRALDVDSTHTRVRNALGLTYYSHGEVSGDPTLTEWAIQQWQSSLFYLPDQPQVHLYLGYAYVSLDQTSAAVENWRKVIEMAPGTDYARDAQSLIDEYGGQ
jgi:tetratricopeptide (TPR) repeat protein